MRSYRQRVTRDVERWHQKGWVTADGQKAIAAELADSRWSVGLAPALAVLGAVLFGFAAMSFVAANWQDLPKLVRLMMLLGSLAACYGVAGVLFSRGLPAFAHAAILLGVGIFGASIMLISQMYHIDGHPPDAVLLWAGGALLAGVALQSPPALASAMLLVALWSGWEQVISQAVHWPFLIGWAAVATAFFWLRWRPGLHLSALTLGAWIVMLGYLLGRGHEHGLVVGIGLAIAAAALAAEHLDLRLDDRLRAIAPTAFGYGIAIAFAGLFALQFLQFTGTLETSRLVGYAVFTLALMIGVIAWAFRTGHGGVLWLGYAGFSLEILSLYFKTVGTLLGSSLFFLVAGLLVIALAYAAHRLRAQQQLGMEAQS